MEQMANPTQTVEQLQAQLDQDLRLRGICVKWKVPNQMGEVMEEWRIPPACAIPCPPTSRFPNGYYRIQPVSPNSGMVYEWMMPPKLSTPSVVPAEWIEMVVTDEHKNRPKPFSQEEPV